MKIFVQRREVSFDSTSCRVGYIGRGPGGANEELRLCLQTTATVLHSTRQTTRRDGSRPSEVVSASGSSQSGRTCRYPATWQRRPETTGLTTSHSRRWFSVNATSDNGSPTFFSENIASTFLSKVRVVSVNCLGVLCLVEIDGKSAFTR